MVYESEDGTVVLKRPIKKNGEVPSEEQFERFMEFSAGLNHPNILCYDGVFFLESLQMPLMTCSVRQYLQGKRVQRDGKSVGRFLGWGSMRPKLVKLVAVGVAKGLSYLHSQIGVSHDGLSSSNVLLSCKSVLKNRLLTPREIEEVKLVDYQLGLLGTSSQSHVSRNCMYKAPEGTDPKRADLYSLGVLMVYMWKGEPWGREREEDWKWKIRAFQNDAVPAMVEMWKAVVWKCLNIDWFPSLTAAEVVSSLEAIGVQY